MSVIGDDEQMNAENFDVGHSDSDANLSYISAVGRDVDSGQHLDMDCLSLGASASMDETFMTPLNYARGDSKSGMSLWNKSSQHPIGKSFR